MAKQRWQTGAICSLDQDPFSTTTKYSGQAPPSAAMYNGRSPDKVKKGPVADTLNKRNPSNREPVPDTLYHTRTVLDSKTGKAVMETAV